MLQKTDQLILRFTDPRLAKTNFALRSLISLMYKVKYERNAPLYLNTRERAAFFAAASIQAPKIDVFRERNQYTEI